MLISIFLSFLRVRVWPIQCIISRSVIAVASVIIYNCRYRSIIKPIGMIDEWSNGFPIFAVKLYIYYTFDVTLARRLSMIVTLNARAKEAEKAKGERQFKKRWGSEAWPLTPFRSLSFMHTNTHTLCPSFCAGIKSVGIVHGIRQTFPTLSWHPRW